MEQHIEIENCPRLSRKRSHSPTQNPPGKESCMDVGFISPIVSPYFYMPSHQQSMYGAMTPMMPYFNINPMPMMAEPIVSEPPKKVQTFSSCTLYPPKPTSPPPSRNNKPNGCKTVFVGHLPENITEGIIKEVFSKCGEIKAVRKNEKNFCHIRFASELQVEQALLLSGYHLQIEDKSEPSYCSRLHVDYAIASENEHDYECLLRTRFRELRHASEKEPSPSKPPIVPFTEYKADIVKKQMRDADEKKTKEAFQVLFSWLRKGECCKKNVHIFYSMITSSCSQIKRLNAETDKINNEIITVNEKMKEEIKMLNDNLKKKRISNRALFNDIESILKYALMQKVSDHLTKAQRRNVHALKTKVAETIQANEDNLLLNRVEDEMEFSDDEDRESEDVDKSKMKEELSMLQKELSVLSEENAKLKKENDLLCNKVSAAAEKEKKMAAFFEVAKTISNLFSEMSNE